MKHTKTFYKLICIVLCAAMLVPLAGCGETRETQREVYAMDTVMTLTAYGKNANAGLSAAKNLVNARPGQRVVIESRTSVIFNAALLVYVMPLVLFIAAYAIAAALGAAEGVCILVSFVSLLVSGFILIQTQRKKKNKSIDFNIIEICEGVQDD